MKRIATLQPRVSRRKLCKVIGCKILALVTTREPTTGRCYDHELQNDRRNWRNLWKDGQPQAATVSRLAIGASYITKREHEVLILYLAGASTGRIAQRLKVSKKTIWHHVSNACERLKANGLIHLVAIVSADDPNRVRQAEPVPGR